MAADPQSIVNLIIISDFNGQNLASLLSQVQSAVTIRANAAPFGQVMQVLLSHEEDHWPLAPCAAVVWTSPEGISSCYRDLLHGARADCEQILADVKEFVRALAQIPPHVGHIFVPTWSVIHPIGARSGLLEMHPRFGAAAVLMKMNLLLAELAADDPRVTVFDSSQWMPRRAEAHDARLWYLSRTPFGLDVFKSATRDFAAALIGLRGKARKLLIVDLDNTLWGGVIGDVGCENLRIGGHDAAGEAYRDFQLGLRALRRRGILIAVVSKNEEQLALDAIQTHPEMILRLDDLAGWRINWGDKARNVAELISELNLAPDAAVFIDDSAVERDRVRSEIPLLLVPEWPRSPIYFPAALNALDCFDSAFISAEDRSRTEMYASERKRNELRIESPERWLRTLGLKVQAEDLTPVNRERAAQLLNKTNQMNMRTRRLSDAELASWEAADNHVLITYRLADKFGDYGLVGIGSLRFDERSSDAYVEDFVLSCRAMGRQIEETMLSVLADRAFAIGARQLILEFIKTSRNQPCLDFLARSGLKRDGSRFVCDPGRRPACPDAVELTYGAIERARSGHLGKDEGSGTSAVSSSK